MNVIATIREHHVAAKDDQSSAPVHEALLSGDVSRVLELLKDGASPHGRGKRNMTLLHIAAMNGFKSIAEQLLLRGAAVDPIEDDFWTPLHLASGHGHPLMVELLLQHGAGIDTQDDEGWTALHQAAGSHAEVVKLLLQNGADATLKTSEGQTPLDRARERMNTAACRLLADHKDVSDQSHGLRTLCKACRGITYSTLSVPLRAQPGSSSNRMVRGYVHSQKHADLVDSASSCVLCMHIQNSITQTVEPENGPICMYFEENASTEGHLFILIWVADLREWYARGNRLGATADEGSTAAVHGNFINRPYPSNALDQKNLDAIKRWLKLCDTTHKSCQVPRNLVRPKRLLDLEPTGSKHSCVLVDTADMETVSWAALSYCWGSRPAQISERATIADFQHPNGIDVNNSPKTCQDAIRTVRALGMRYLWIDALCIVQDDTEDWKAEASKMGDIYRNAKVTIAATGSINTKSGFLSERKHDHFLKLPYDGPGSVNEDYFYVHPALPTVLASVENTTWNKRGWTMQERFLSRNIVHFTSNPVVLECREGTWTELHTANTIDWLDKADWEARAFKDTTALDMSGSRFVSTDASMSGWEAIVLGFCHRSFTFPDDKAWALEGIVHDFQRQTGMRYVEGIWLPAPDSGLGGVEDGVNSAVNAGDGAAVNNEAHSAVNNDAQAAVNNDAETTAVVRNSDPLCPATQPRPKRWTAKLLSKLKPKPSSPPPSQLPPVTPPATLPPPPAPEFTTPADTAGDLYITTHLTTRTAWHASAQHQLLFFPRGPLRSAPRPRAPSWSWLALDGRLRHFDWFGLGGLAPVGSVTFERYCPAEGGAPRTAARIRTKAAWVRRGARRRMGRDYCGVEPVVGGRAVGDVYAAVWDWYYLYATTTAAAGEEAGPGDGGDALGVGAFDVDEPVEGEVCALRLGDETGWQGGVKALLVVRAEGEGEVWRRVGVAEFGSWEGFGSREGFGEGVEMEVLVV